ncbi:MAG TPA: hypothetical protein VD965_10285 [Burkholderiales bacterium]|nr:hypothetical protein [Burkholderiales bacterium]
MRSAASNIQRVGSWRMVFSPATTYFAPAASQYSPSAFQVPSSKRKVWISRAP